MAAAPLILTIGHSTRPVETFVELLWLHEVSFLVDVRHHPQSRWNPQFNRKAMETWVAEAGVGYLSLVDLGGKRAPQLQTENPGLTDPLLRDFADYTRAPEFAAAFERLLDIAQDEQVAIMCAEALPDKCHRIVLSDLLTARGVRVEHILGPDERRAHALSPAARVRNGRVVYPALAEDLP